MTWSRARRTSWWEQGHGTRLMGAIQTRLSAETHIDIKDKPLDLNAFFQTLNPYLLLGARRSMAACKKGQQRAALRMTDVPTLGVQKARELLLLLPALQQLLLLLILWLAGAEG